MSDQSVATLPVTKEASNIKVEIIDDNIIDPMDVQLINNVHHTGSAAYTGEFTTAPENGVNMNVRVENNGDSAVFINIGRNDHIIVDGYELSLGSQKTISFEEMLGHGLIGDWKVYIYNKTGDKYALNINARQF
ncbi:hypothetical protein [Paenibacillus lentus]|uniref:P/Homo B domain-containing protein n=1 Tax=Paenibacillus lentus TaxID=1338368 RepID=A0A3Q8S677_9BACL|nr:hypothetical protein [Paenibacillus lentus]AZK48223.1 hypothetical protein EIM92_20275 [Paenibacillus lentus]